MKCQHCGRENENGKFCASCGAPLPELENQGGAATGPAPYKPAHADPNAGQGPRKPKKSKGKIAFIVIAVIVGIAIIGSALGGGKDDGKNSGASGSGTSQSDSDKKDQASKTEPYETELASGNYTAGIDFPAGTYTITAVSGTGNVSSSNMYSGGLNVMMGIEENESLSSLYETEFKNAKLPDGTVLKVSGGVKIKIASDAANTGNMKERENPLTEEVSLSAGNYVAGTDFPAGTYDIIAVSGGGNVSSSNMYDGGLNAILGVDQALDMYETEYKNIVLSKDVTLTVTGVVIKLVPSKS